ncbi:MAG: response regulator [Nitrospirae bacterium]|nr:response regulator [Nitrospirota bacterium]
MSNKEEDFRRRLLSTFKAEAEEHLNAISAGLVELEKIPAAAIQTEIVETIFRRCHSMKGAARAVNMTGIEAVCHSIEGIYSVWKQKGVRPSRKLFDVIYKTINTIRTIVSSIDGEQADKEKIQVSKIIAELESSAWGAEFDIHASEKETVPASAPSASGFTIQYPSDTVRISTRKLGSLLLQSEEMLNLKQAAEQHYTTLLDLSSGIEQLKKDLPEVPAGTLTAVDRKFIQLIKSTKKHNRVMSMMIDNLLDDVKRVMLLPFSTILEGFPILVHDIAREEGKEVDLVVQGEGVEIDRRVLEDMKDPLIHMIRNSISHGIDGPDARMINKKMSRGTLRIAISQFSGDKVEIIVSDDGAGIDVQKVKDEAVKNGVISQMAADSLSGEDAINLIFHSGVSTSPVITDVSGRGLGLAIMREKVERLGGDISVETRIHAGTTFYIVLPLTVATFRGILVKSSNQVFIVPATNIDRTGRVNNDDIKTVENMETITLNGRPVSFVRLESILGLSSGKNGRGSMFTQIIVLRSAEKQIALGVDEVLNEQEVLAKGLGRQLSRVRNVAGAAILGSGKPVPILNIPDLIRSAVKATAAPAATIIPEEKGWAEKGYVLVVEDSITSRILLKNILESAGYRVKTAVDGIDAITTLKNEDFNLVVSDIDMPGMNGFDLTAKIRGDKSLADLPVVLVTALESREDRERGIEVGADSYIVKSSFDQSNLLEVIRRLI